MGWNLFGDIAKSGADIAKTAINVKNNKLKIQNDLQAQVLKQYSNEFQKIENGNGFTATVLAAAQCANSLVRPTIIYSGLALLLLNYFVPQRAQEFFISLEFIPDRFWDWGEIILQFYFGGKILEKGIGYFVKKRKFEAVQSTTEKIIEKDGVTVVDDSNKGNSISWDFIKRVEGYSTSGYMPKDPDGSSGVTISNGIDLAYVNRNIVKKKDIKLYEKIEPYIGLKGSRAERFLKENPLVLTEAQCFKLSNFKKTKFLKSIKSNCRRNGFEFVDLPSELQTIIYSRVHHLGSLSKMPKFWSTVIKYVNGKATIKDIQYQLINFFNKPADKKLYRKRMMQESSFIKKLK